MTTALFSSTINRPLEPSSPAGFPSVSNLSTRPIAFCSPRALKAHGGSNPFARPKPLSSNSFSRETLLPTRSPKKSSLGPVSLQSADPADPQCNVNPNATPGDKATSINGAALATGSATREKRQGWRMLWRGGLEVGRDGWKLDGITFFAMLSFPSTPSQVTTNPFDVPITTPSASGTSSVPGQASASPFPHLPSADTDLCLSLESMRGRKYLQVRGVVDLPEDEVLEGEGSDEGGVQLSLSPQAPLLRAYFSSLLCRNPKLSPSGRTLSAMIIGLGDEGVEPSHNSTLLVYGQRQLNPSPIDSSIMTPTLRLCVSRRKPPPVPASAKKVRPGDPLPRPPLFFPVKSQKSLSFHTRRVKPLSRASSVSSIYLGAPGETITAATADRPVVKSRSSAPASATASGSAILSESGPNPPPGRGRTPGRRGEKRKRQAEDQDVEDEKRRRSGKIVPARSMGDIRLAVNSNLEPDINADYGVRSENVKAEARDDGEEDIFGKRPNRPEAPVKMARTSSDALAPPSDGLEASIDFDGRDEAAAGMTKGQKESSGEGNKGKRARVPQQILDNKATIRKQALMMLEARGYQRQQQLFKDVFSMSIKGTYFVFRDGLEKGPLAKSDIQRIINGHLEMYLPATRLDQVEGKVDIDRSMGSAWDGRDKSEVVASPEEETLAGEPPGILDGGDEEVIQGEVDGRDLRRLFAQSHGSGSGHRRASGSTVLEGIEEEDE